MSHPQLMISSSHTVFTGLTSIDGKLRQRKEMSNNNSFLLKFKMLYDIIGGMKVIKEIEKY